MVVMFEFRFVSVFVKVGIEGVYTFDGNIGDTRFAYRVVVYVEEMYGLVV